QHINLPADLIIGQGSTSAVDLTVSGRRNTIRTLKDQDVQVSVDLSDLSEGRHLIKLSAKNIFLPFGVKIDQVAPQKIMVNLQPRSESQDAN
ncbi:MAG TPA: CdaR family protein, partial [Desulfobacterales bacterium]|nr:CdaR family protein [Desulfobacterales bacterium]